ncbi:MAG: hypothetical protein AB1486_03025 [Planctomycetota bacterium]
MNEPEPAININQYSIVVLGAMNPAIHHPKWYQAVGMLTDDEAGQAVRSGGLVVIPHVAQFQTAGMLIQCTTDRWQVNTAEAQHRRRMLDLAVNTFDRLAETPISAYGFNAQFDVTVDLRVVTSLGVTSSQKPLDLSFHGMDPALESFAFSYSFPPLEIAGQPRVHRQLKATIARSSRARDALVVDTNAHHQIEPEPQFSRFDLPVLLRESADVHATEDALLRHLLSRLAGPGE